MTYNYYQRKKEDITYHESKWIKDNILKISQEENVLFVFQVLYEVLLITDKNIYFPNRPTLINLKFQDISKIKISGNLLLELITNKNIAYAIVFVTPIDKVKFYHVMQLVKNNLDKALVTTFELIEKEFNEFKMLKFPPNQSQHKIPQVYLKQFGYLYKDQWKVTVMIKGEKFTRQKSIESFTAETNVFDIDSEDDRFPRMFETINAELENLYPAMIEDISTNKEISDGYWEVLIQLVPNLIVRSDFWRDFVEEMLKLKDKNAFLDILISVLVKSYEDLQELKKKQFYRELTESDFSTSILNKTLILFLNYFCHHLQQFNVVIIKAQDGKPFFTSDNPVNFVSNQEKGKFGLFCNNTEVYFPISKNYLAYFHHSSSEQKSPKFRELKNRIVCNAMDVLNDAEYDNLTKEQIINASDKLVIFPMELKYSDNTISTPNKET